VFRENAKFVTDYKGLSIISELGHVGPKSSRIKISKAIIFSPPLFHCIKPQGFPVIIKNISGQLRSTEKQILNVL